MSFFQSNYNFWYRNLRRKPENGWRVWRVAGDRLISPHFEMPLPIGGVAVAVCDQGHQPPEVGCECGMNVLPYVGDVQGYLRFGAARDAYDVGIAAVTFGGITGPVLPGVVPYFHLLRCAAYEVKVIVTDSPNDLVYEVPVIRAPWESVRDRLDSIAEMAQ